MNTAVKTLLDAVLSLPEQERAVFAQAVIQSLDSNVADETDESFLDELDRRADEIRNDPTCAQPWSEVKNLR